MHFLYSYYQQKNIMHLDIMKENTLKISPGDKNVPSTAIILVLLWDRKMSRSLVKKRIYVHLKDYR